MKRFINLLLTEIKLYKVYFNLKKKVRPFNLNKNKSLILFEFSNYSASQIGGYYFISHLLKKEKLDIKGFYNGYGVKTPFRNHFMESLKWKIKNIFSLGFFKIYKAYGVNNIIIPNAKYINLDETNRLYEITKKKIKSKKDVLKISIKNTFIGDLIYDTYLNRYLKPTIEITDSEFLKVLKECIALTLYWHDFFKKNNVKYLVGTHGVYSYAIPFRVALKFGIKGFLTNLHGIKQVTKEFIYEHSPDRNKKILFNKISTFEKKSFIKKSKQELKRIISGHKVKERDYTLKKSSFLNKNNFRTKLIKPTNRLKVLISPHDFFDAAHGFGDHELFEDYYEWLKFTFDLSKKTNYDWYVKTHPDLVGRFGEKQRATRKVVDELVHRFSNVRLLPPNYSHSKIIKEGIDAVITCHGSIAYEYAMNNVPAIIASKCNPYKEFKFSVQPKNRNEYKKIILNLNKTGLKFKINKKNIYEFYALKFHVTYTLNWVFDYRDYCKFIGSWYNWQSPRIFEYWMLKKDKILDQKINKNIKNFLNSKLSMLFSFHLKK